ncbi:hypothetical protein Gogos_014926 [Gossypium gossypioides]|uniref:Protein kinase domain-containing protein n=1 Tax=Gossypium gossypioides TaxID=34282 RepID=A0A7J9C083_GOSGO|nr:hypothetical protein [Gossypium gossypioides]
MGFCLHTLPSFSEVLKEIKSKLRPTKSNALNTRRLALPEELCCRFSLADIKAATNNFHKNMIIAEGDTGFIFGGKINDGFYAIKRLRPTSDSHLPLLELRYGVKFLSQLHHPNIISLLGYCDEKEEMIHVYEYANNGSLYDNLHAENHDPIPWKRRLEICISDDSSKNILLDDQWTSKLCNFSFCKRGPHSMSRDPISIEIESDIAYTSAFIAPEVAITGRVSHKTDVFSFGVVLFEVLCCRRIFDAELEMDQRFLYRWARKCIENGTIYSIIDPYLKGKIAPQCLKKFLEIAYSCVQFEENRRPTMGEVEVTLELALELQKQAESEMESTNPQAFVASRTPMPLIFAIQIEAATTNFHQAMIISHETYGEPIYRGLIDDGTLLLAFIIDECIKKGEDKDEDVVVLKKAKSQRSGGSLLGDVIIVECMRDVCNGTHFVIPFKLWYEVVTFRRVERTFLRGANSSFAGISDQDPFKGIGRLGRSKPSSET